MVLILWIQILLSWVCLTNAQPTVIKAEKYSKVNLSVLEDEVSVGIFDLEVDRDLYVFRPFGSAECFANQSCHVSGKIKFIPIFLKIFFLNLTLCKLARLVIIQIPSFAVGPFEVLVILVLVNFHPHKSVHQVSLLIRTIFGGILQNLSILPSLPRLF